MDDDHAWTQTAKGLFSAVWLVSFAFGLPAGENPLPRSLVAREYFSGSTIRAESGGFRPAVPPFPVDDGVLTVFFDAPTELWCFRSLDWPMPLHVLDLAAEFRRETAGLRSTHAVNMAQASMHFGLPLREAAYWLAQRTCALRYGIPEADAVRVMDRCAPDIEALTRLFERSGLPLFGGEGRLFVALLFGRYAKAVASMQATGIPIDRELLASFRTRGRQVLSQFISASSGRGFWREGRFSTAAFDAWLKTHDVDWPYTATGRLSLTDDVFKDMAPRHPIIDELRQIRKLGYTFRDLKLAVGQDGRNRTPLWPLASRTGRNQPSGNRFAFGLPSCLRGIIRPEPGMALAYLDWAQQEFGCAAYLSDDANMKKAYESGDPYLAFAIQTGLAPAGATCGSHPLERERCKACLLGIQYGMGAESLARRLGCAKAQAEVLSVAHRKIYPSFWAWQAAVALDAQRLGEQQSPLGWRCRIAAPYNPCAVGNFPLQSAGADMLRLVCCFGIERGVKICAPIHDAVLIEAEEDGIGRAADIMREAMAEASRVVLNGAALRTDVRIVSHPGRLLADRHRPFWDRLVGLIEEDET